MVASMVEYVLLQEYAHVPLDGLVIAAHKVRNDLNLNTHVSLTQIFEQI